MKWLVLICAFTTGCVETQPVGEPDGTSQMMKIAKLPAGHGIFVIRDYEHGQLCTIAKRPDAIAISCQAWELPPP